MIQVESFDYRHECIEMLYDGVGWIVDDGEIRQYHLDFLEASRAMDDLIQSILGEEAA